MSEVKYALEKFERALVQLGRGVAEAKDDLDKDGVIQRFEFSFELLWKATRIFLSHKGVEVKTPRDALKEAFRVGLIEDEQRFLNMLEDRNRTSHIYDRETSEAIFGKIKSDYFPEMENFLSRLKREVS